MVWPRSDESRRRVRTEATSRKIWKALKFLWIGKILGLILRSREEHADQGITLSFSRIDIFDVNDAAAWAPVLDQYCTAGDLTWMFG